MNWYDIQKAGQKLWMEPNDPKDVISQGCFLIVSFLLNLFIQSDLAFALIFIMAMMVIAEGGQDWIHSIKKYRRDNL